jgi:hypothetical protein
MKLPYGERAKIQQIIDKLESYSLNRNHSSGKHKARLFRSKLGIDLQSKEILATALMEAANSTDAIFTGSDQYGDRYVIDFELKTEAGVSWIRSAWMIRQAEDYPRLTSVYPIRD